ncbi:MAG: substrate-binding domain-containing protein, partial [Siculibacillus sp.]|nr:substrate-binding domain-containing protein [Siculibacillus sp.]
PDDAGRRSGPRTIAEIAEATGFSRTTVRFVVSGQAERHRIKAETRVLIEDHVARHGLVVDHTARSLRTRRSEAVGLVVPDLANAFFARLTAELEERCHASGRGLLTASSHEDPEREAQAVAGLIGRGVDGLVVAPCRPPAAFKGLRRGGRTALVMVDRAHEHSPYPTVVSDNADAARRIAARLIEIAGDSVDLLCACPELPSIADRLAGFRAAAETAGLGAIAERIHATDRDEPGAGAALMAAILAGGHRPRALMCSSLLMLEGALSEIVSRFGRLPGDLVLGTFDHHPLLDALPVRILSLRQDERGIAERAFACLLAEMEGGPRVAVRHVVPGRLVERGAPPP